MFKKYTSILIVSLLCLISQFACDNNNNDTSSKDTPMRLDNDGRYVKFPTRYMATALPFNSRFLNNKNQVAGLVEDNHTLASVLWSSATGVQIIDPGHELTDSVPICQVDDGYMSIPLALSDNGMVLGKHEYYCSGRVDYFIWEASSGSIFIEDRYPNTFNLAYGLDNQGNILGNCKSGSTTSFINHCILNWNSGEVVDIPYLDYVSSDGFSYHSYIFPAISPAGVVASNCTQRRDLCTWDATNGLASINLNLDSSTFIFNIYDVNDNGEIVGNLYSGDLLRAKVFYANIQDGYYFLPRVVFEDSYQSSASINNAGLIVGSENLANSSDFYALVWQNHVGYDLNRLLSNSASKLEEAYAINNQGNILARTIAGQTYLLTSQSAR